MSPTLNDLPIPQADDLDKVFAVADLVAGGAENSADVSDRLGVVRRQGFYYTAAAEALLLIQRGRESLTLLPVGEDYVRRGEVDEQAFRRGIVLHAPIIRHIASELGMKPRTKVPEQLLDVEFVAGMLEDLGLASDTAERRAYTIRSWLKAVA